MVLQKIPFLEATMGFEPMMRVLQTLALPLGDVAELLQNFGWQPQLIVSYGRQPLLCQSGQRDSNPRPSPWQGDVLPLYYARIVLRSFRRVVPRDRIELTTPRFSVACSTN